MDSLITVVVVAYNSSSFIIEALDSVYNQTWRKIELIVTDDCSNDNTVELCHSWMDIHKSRFVRIMAHRKYRVGSYRFILLW